MRSITKDELRRLRNEVSVNSVIDQLGIERSRRGSRTTHRCHHCSSFHTVVLSRSNLAHCFRCDKSRNPIDIVMAVLGVGFLDAVRHLQTLDQQPTPAPLQQAEH